LLSFHRLTEQVPSSAFDAFVARRINTKETPAAKIRFHVVARKQLEFGVTTSNIEGISASVSDFERTLLDVIEHPRVFLGIDRGVELL
jgi:predicted transcriptional regulator of viral defense system